MTDDPDAVLVHDGDCSFCSAAASALRRVEGVGVVPWRTDAARTFLEAQFGEAPFAVVFVDRAAGEVYVGRAAASELCERAGLPTLVGDVIGENYESLADAIRNVTGVERDPDPYHGRYPLSTAAREAYDDLAAAAETPTPEAMAVDRHARDDDPARPSR